MADGLPVRPNSGPECDVGHLDGSSRITVSRLSTDSSSRCRDSGFCKRLRGRKEQRRAPPGHAFNLRTSWKGSRARLRTLGLPSAGSAVHQRVWVSAESNHLLPRDAADEQGEDGKMRPPTPQQLTMDLCLPKAPHSGVPLRRTYDYRRPGHRPS